MNIYVIVMCVVIHNRVAMEMCVAIETDVAVVTCTVAHNICYYDVLCCELTLLCCYCSDVHCYRNLLLLRHTFP